MANTVAIRFRNHVPGVGFDGNGNPANRKARVLGRITVTSLANGESLKPSDVGLTTIDHIVLEVTEGIGGASGSEPRTAHYSYASQEFYVLQDDDSANTSGNNYTLSFDAFGDSAHVVDLV